MRIGCPIGLSLTRQISLLWRAEEAAAATGCPIAFEQAAPVEFLPQGRTHQGKEPGEAVSPLAEAGPETQQQIDEQGRPHLPAHGVGVVTEKVGQLQGLFEFLEEHFNRLPPRRTWTPSRLPPSSASATATRSSSVASLKPRTPRAKRKFRSWATFPGSASCSPAPSIISRRRNRSSS